LGRVATELQRRYVLVCNLLKSQVESSLSTHEFLLRKKKVDLSLSTHEFLLRKKNRALG
jgi:hypothetical protein